MREAPGSNPAPHTHPHTRTHTYTHAIIIKNFKKTNQPISVYGVSWNSDSDKLYTHTHAHMYTCMHTHIIHTYDNWGKSNTDWIFDDTVINF
jgi:hypothetical protein